MIAFLKGRPVSSGTDCVIIDVSGVGYKVFVPTPVIGFVSETKEDVIIHTYMHVREDTMQLFGFLQESDRQVFELLIQVSGIGPRVALGVMSAMPVPSFVSAVVHEQVQVLTQIPGVGKKTAQRVIIELKDKLGKLEAGSTPEMSVAVGSSTDESGDALHALIALGYNAVEARKVLSKVMGTGASLSPEELVRKALKELGRF
jgi:Holliday junction DNA helicase RuvA